MKYPNICMAQGQRCPKPVISIVYSNGCDRPLANVFVRYRMTIDVAGAVSYLDQSTPQTISVLTHVGEVYDKLLDYGSDRPLDYFEPFSYLVKEERDPEKNPLLLFYEKVGPDFDEAAIRKSRHRALLFPRQKLTAEGEEEEDSKEAPAEPTEEEPEEKHGEEETANEGEIPNIIGEMRWMSQVGVGLTPREARLLQVAVEKFIKTHPVSSTRFWGKLFGGDRDYYILECEYNDGARPHAAHEEEEKGEPVEGEAKPQKVHKVPVEEDTGPNAFGYFVCNNLGTGWTALPDVTPQQIVASRSIRHFFTGRLDAAVLAPPGRFDGTEKELLRAVIARIVQSCTIAMTGMYKPEEEPEEDVPLEANSAIVLNEEWSPKPITGLDSFVHRVPALLPQGRTEFWAPETEEEEKEKDRVVEKGPPILRPLSLDEPLPHLIPSWSLRTVTVVAPIGWSQPNIPGVSLPAEGKRYESHIRTERSQVIWLRSNTWPGLNIVVGTTTDRIVMHYYGWGTKATPPLDWPVIPEPPKKVVRVEEEEEEEHSEPEKKPAEGEEEEEDSDLGRAPKPAPAKAKPVAESESDESGTYDSAYDGSGA
jgi:radial spoke head protein 4A